MDIRYSANQKDVKRYTTQELRDEFLIQDLYQPDTVRAVYSHVDRMVTVGIMPVNETVPLDKGIDVWHSFGTQFFLERREIGFFNLGGGRRVRRGRDGVPHGPQGLHLYHQRLQGRVLPELRPRQSRPVLRRVRPGPLRL